MPMEYMNDRARLAAQGQYPVDPEFMRAFSAPKEKSDLVESIESMEKELSELKHQIGMIRATLCVNYTQPRSQDGIVIDDLQASTIDMLVEVLKGYNKKLTDQSNRPFAPEWVTRHAPDTADAHDSSGNCVEVTYANGLLGWEPLWEMRKWRAGQDDTQVVAWREIREAFKPSK